MTNTLCLTEEDASTLYDRLLSLSKKLALTLIVAVTVATIIITAVTCLQLMGVL